MKTSTILIGLGIGAVALYAYSQLVKAQQPTWLQTLTGAGVKLTGLLLGGSDSSSSTNPTTGTGGDASVAMIAHSPAGNLDTATTAWSSNTDAAMTDSLPSARIAGRQLQPSAYMSTDQASGLGAPMPALN